MGTRDLEAEDRGRFYGGQGLHPLAFDIEHIFPWIEEL